MTWTDSTWDAFVALLEGWWPGEFAEESADAWRLALDDTDPQAAITGLKALLHQGRKFRPSASELLAELRSDPSQPTWDEAYHLIYGRKGILAAWSDKERQAQRLAAAHPLVRSFVERQTIERLMSIPVEEPDWGAKHRKDLEGKWNAHVEAMDGREIAALASGSRDGLRQLDPLGSLALGAGDVR